ncbi:hypothetical protein EVAR_84651_1 [Eumeta japonica]|uniref:ATP-dependent DNA helicase n=1 Tax=Eumeta variegata TaxID=151549 RepID=A0A4C1UZ81_EUMVA|nr:hypothetical protein EVAR_84651_1 [Eumeta japonica]
MTSDTSQSCCHQGTSVSQIRPNSKQADVIPKASLTIWDEISMVSKHALSVLDKHLKDLMNVQFPFGGETVVFGGEFRQISPVWARGFKGKSLSTKDDHRADLRKPLYEKL